MNQKRKLKQTRVAACATHPQVAIIDGKNVVEFRDVKIGVDKRDVVQIEFGLKEDDKAALNLGAKSLLE
jgi:hypothetical protein